MPRFARPNSYVSAQSNQDKTGAARAANATEAAAGDAENLYISPATLASAVGDLVPSATTAIEGVVLLTDNNSPVATKFYVDAIAIAGAPAWSESVSGIGQLATTAEAQAATNDNVAMTPLKVAELLATPPAIGGTTPAAGSFSTLAASGAVDFDAGGSWESAGTAIDIGADADTAAINIGSGAAARVITIGNVSAASNVVINSGTAGIQMASTGAGDIAINSDDTLLLDADGVLELNSSGGAIGIGNDADAQNINVGTGAAARVITVGNNTGATQLVLEAGSGGLDIGTAASAQSITIGNDTGASALVMLVGSGNFSLDGVAASTYAIGASTTTGSITIGGTAQTGNFNLGVSSGIMTANLVTGNGAKTLNIATGVSGNTVNLASGINTSAQVVNISSGASGANSTVNVLSGNGSAGTQTFNVLTGTRAGALNLATGAALHVIAIGSASAGAVTVDTSAGISLDAATASNFTVTGAADLSLISTLGSVVINAEEAAADAIQLTSAAGGLAVDVGLQIVLDSAEAAVADSVRIVASAADGGIDVDAGTNGVAIDSTGAISLDGAAASNFSVSGAGIDLTLDAAAGRLVLLGGEAAADAVRIQADDAAGGGDFDFGTGGFALDTTGGISLDSATASNLTVTGAGQDLTLSSAGGRVDITATEAAANAIVLSASDAAGGIDLSTGGGSIDLSSAGFVTMVPAVDSVAGDTATINADVCSATFTSFTTAAGAQQTFTITNSQIAADSVLFVTVSNVGSNDARMTLEQVKPAAGSVQIMTQNNGAAALNGDVIINVWRIA